jgi:hypothetical protein
LKKENGKPVHPENLQKIPRQTRFKLQAAGGLFLMIINQLF